MKEVTLPDVYRLFREAVRYWPTTDPGRPNTFAVIENEEVFSNDIQNEQLGYTLRAKDKPHLFSRAWELARYNPSAFTWAYPGVFIFEENMTVSNMFNPSAYKQWNLSINILINHNPDAAIYKTRSELYIEAENMLLNLFTYLNRCGIATTSVDAVAKPYNRDWLNFNTGLTYVWNEAKSRAFLSEIIKYNNDTKTFNRIFLDNLQAVCVWTDLKIVTNCNDATITDFEFYDSPEIIYDREPDPYLIKEIIVGEEEEPIIEEPLIA